MGVVIPFEGSEERSASLEPLIRLVEADMGKVNEAILARAQSHVELIPELAGHLINSGGKRIRPMLTVAAARLCGYARRTSRQARDLGRVHAHGDAASRRCRR